MANALSSHWFRRKCKTPNEWPSQGIRFSECGAHANFFLLVGRTIGFPRNRRPSGHFIYCRLVHLLTFISTNVCVWGSCYLDASRSDPDYWCDRMKYNLHGYAKHVPGWVQCDGQTSNEGDFTLSVWVCVSVWNRFEPYFLRYFSSHFIAYPSQSAKDKQTNWNAFFGIHQNMANTITRPSSSLQSCGCLHCTFDSSLQAINHIDMLSKHVTHTHTHKPTHAKTAKNHRAKGFCVCFVRSENKKKIISSRL